MPHQILRLPGLVDPHVHLRDPGQTAKEDFTSGTAAALAGGYTAVFDMPNNAVPVTDRARLLAKAAAAEGRLLCDVGLYLGSLGDDLAELADPAGLAWGLKLYLNRTTGGYLLGPDRLPAVLTAWTRPGPVLVHAEADTVGGVLDAAGATGRRVHVCHVARRAELEQVVEARRRGVAVTCGVTPHHLFLTAEDAARMGPFGQVRPELVRTADVEYLWEHLDEIDVVESDHAPHTRADKEAGAFGFPGLETTLPLMLQAVQEGRLTLDRVVQLCSSGPRALLGLPEEPDTWVEVEQVEVRIGEGDVGGTPLRTKCGWTPFAGRQGFGRVRRVVLRGVDVYRDGDVVPGPGQGRLLVP